MTNFTHHGNLREAHQDKDAAADSVSPAALAVSLTCTRSTNISHRDLDQIQADLLSPRHLQQYKETKAAEDLPGLGRHYCIECAKWFESETSLVAHRRGKPHKRM